MGDIADIVGGGTPSTGNQSYWDGDIDWYAPAEIADQIYANSSQKKITGLGYENSSAKMLPPGTVLFTSRAGIGKTAILTRKGCTNQGFQSIVPHRGELDSYFIFSRTEELKRYGELVGAGSTFVEVSGKQMAVMELMMPPTMREQQTIGGFFQQLDHLITLHQRQSFSHSTPDISLSVQLIHPFYTSSWEQRKLGELVDVCSGRDYKHLSEGTIPVYGTGGYMLSVNDALSYDRDAIGIGRKGTIDRPYILKAPFWTVDTLFYAIPREKVDLNYAFDIFQNIDWKKKDESTGVPSLSKTAINDIDVLAPKHDEQQIIGQFFAAIDNLITLHQRKCANLCSPSQVVFSLLFATSTFSWEQRKFGEITSKYEDPVPTPHDGYYRLGIRSHAKGTFHSYVAKGQELETAQMHRVAAGNFIVNITFGWEHAVAITDKNDAGKLVSHRFPQFSFAEGMVPEFFRYVIVDEKFRHHLWLASPGGAGRNRVLKLDEMLNYLMRFPSRDEQIKIAEFFRHLDNLITLHQRQAIVYAVIRSIRKVILAERQYFAPPMVRKSP